jgi:iron complex transport system substrate-binding protein
MQACLQDVRRVAPAGRRPRLVHVEWIDPLMVGGHWMHELAEAAGLEHGLGVRDGDTRPIAWTAVRTYDPEVVVVAPCGFTVAQTDRDRSRLEALEGWAETTAARSGRVFVSDGNAYFNRPGPRLVETAEILQAAAFGRSASHRFPSRALRSF